MGTSQYHMVCQESAVGSSPRVWGQEKNTGSTVRSTGIIPTRMGTSSVLVCGMLDIRDHPHAYGDKSSTRESATQEAGSSPRVWGQATSIYEKVTRAGIIPTRMGTSFRQGGQRLWHKDHPHAYGDKSSTQFYQHIHVGSSPRVWGQVTSFVYSPLLNRIIPTRMGTRSKSFVNVVTKLDHPHAYGDKLAAVIAIFEVKGSSPRVWGQADEYIRTDYMFRIIPTRMGTRLKKSRKIAVLQNQPLRFPLTFHRSFV